MRVSPSTSTIAIKTLVVIVTMDNFADSVSLMVRVAAIMGLLPKINCILESIIISMKMLLTLLSGVSRMRQIYSIPRKLMAS